VPKAKKHVFAAELHSTGYFDSSAMTLRRYIAITPARDEEEFLPAMIASMVSQTVLPARWILIDDGSKDRTAEIVDEAARRYPWIEPKHLQPERARLPGGESVIMRFLPREVWQDADFIVRFDSDMKFERDYIERLLAEFERDPKLGIASGTLIEPFNGEWKLSVLPSYHTRGPSKVYSRRCFEAIGGLEPGVGWDSIDEAKAMMHGFRTQSFRDIVAYHCRLNGSALGMLRSRFSQGRTCYYIGYSPIFASARAFGFFHHRPYLVGTALFLAGFWSGYAYRLPQVADRALIKWIRRQQMRRLTFRQSVWQ